MDRKVFFSLVMFSVLVLMLHQVFNLVAPLLVPIGWAVILGIVTAPLYEKLLLHLNGRDQLAAGIMTVGIMLVLVIPFVGLAFFLVQQGVIAHQYLETAASGVNSGTSLDTFMQHPFVARWVEYFRPYIDPLGLDIRGNMIPAAKKLAATLLGYASGIVANFFVFVFMLIIMLVVLFFIYRDGRLFKARFWSVIPLSESRRERLAGTVEKVVSAVIFGIFMTCLIQGVLGGLAFWFTGLPSPALFGALMAGCALIPVVGTALVWGPGAFYLFVQGETVKAVILALWGIFLVGSIDNLIRPIFIVGKAKLSLLMIILGIFGGVISFGFIGIVAGPVLLAVFMELFDIYREELFPGAPVEQEPPAKS